LLQYDPHKKLQECVKDLNHLLRSEPALYENQFNVYGFEWVDLNHREDCVLVYRRRGKHQNDDLLVILNVAPVPRWDWEIEITGHRYQKEIFNSDLQKYWGSGNVTNPEIRMKEITGEENSEESAKKYKLIVNLPPLAAVILK
jgi:1,4-alpha-glucan branching enzyme